MNKLISTWRGWLVAIFAMAILTACAPIADIVAPPVAEIGASVAFSAQLYEPSRDTAANDLQYTWNFGDGTIVHGRNVSHVYTSVGTYQVLLGITDSALRQMNQEYLSQATIKIVAAGQVSPLKVSVLSAGGTPLVAEVKMTGAKRQTEMTGSTVFESTSSLDPVVLQVAAPGFISQSVLVDALDPMVGSDRAAEVRLQRAADGVPVADISKASDFHGGAGAVNATVKVPDGAFVDPDGQLVQGAATISITPSDIRSLPDMSAAPGQLSARDASGRSIRLLSFGMMAVQVKQGDRLLQLASGKTAEISVDLPVSLDDKGRAFSVGDKLPLWHFDEAAGVWLPGGEGEVIASQASASGLALRAQVSHFSSWALATERSSLNVQGSRECFWPASDTTSVPLRGPDCQITVVQTLPNGMRLSDRLPHGSPPVMTIVPGAQVQVIAVSQQLAGRGVLNVDSANSSNVSLSVPLTEQVVVYHTEQGDIPVVNETPLNFSVNLPIADANASGEEFVSAIRVTGNGVTADVADESWLSQLGAATETDSVTQRQLSYALSGMGNAAGPLGAGRLSGDLTVSVDIARSSVSVVTGELTTESARTITMNVTVPAVNYSGTTLISGKGFTLWNDVAGSNAVLPNGMVEYRVAALGADGTLDRDMWRSAQADTWGRFIVKHGLSNCDDYLTPVPVVLELKVTDSSGVVHAYRTRPYLTAVNACR